MDRYTDDGKIQILGRWVKPRDLSLYAAIVLFVSTGLATVFSQVGIAIASILGLLGALTWYLVETTKQAEKKSEDLHASIGKMLLVRPPDNLFTHGIAAIRRGEEQGGWDMVRIYAPVGLWDKSEEKDKWLTALQAALNNGHDVRGFWGVYGLPPNEKLFDSYGKRRLDLFATTPNTELHFLPPEDVCHPTAAPGLGIIIFEREVGPEQSPTYEVFIGFALERENPVVGSGVGLTRSDVGRLVAVWFDSKVFYGASSRYVLRGPDTLVTGQKITFDEGIQKIRDLYKSPKPAEPSK